AVLELSRRVLSERQFEIFTLHDIEGVGYEEIAVRLSMSQESVRMALSRARKAIRELYRKGIY
ncbi:RNA polymerase sigma factor, partial [Muribaculum intestinale]